METNDDNIPFLCQPNYNLTRNVDRILDDSELEQFKQYGYILLQKAFPREVALQCKEVMWNAAENRSTVRKDDPSTWPVKLPLDSTFFPSDGSPWSEVFSPRLLGAIDEICGGSNSCQSFGAGWWMITFPVDTSDSWRVEGNWHIDGGTELVRYPFSKEIGLVLIMYFSDVVNDGGGTAVLEGSHNSVARQLIRCGLRGAKNKALVQSVFDWPDEAYNIVELIGQAGDVLLLHPLLIHARSRNLGAYLHESGVRFMCHPTIALKTEMDFSKPVELFSPLESSIYEAAMMEEDGLLVKTLRRITIEACEDLKHRRSCNNQDTSEAGAASDYEDPSSVVQVEESELYSVVGFKDFGGQAKKTRFD